MAYSAMTYLEAINEILINAGLTPVNGLISVPEVDKAQLLLNSTSRQIQSLGWNFNTDTNRKLSPDHSAGNIIVPQDTMSIDTVGPSHNIKVTLRGNILRKVDWYDESDPTVFSEPVYVDIVHYLNFEDIPQSARYYITIKAARRFADSYLSSSVIHGFSAQEEQQALIAAYEEDGTNADYNMLTNLGYTQWRSLDG
jgi:hypothetical protein